MSVDNFDLSGIIVLTGLPGAAKTLRAMAILERAVKEGRPAFQCGINACTLPGVQSWDDPHAWKELPPRAVLVVDEGQDHFRARAGSVAVPKYITDMERIRHDAVCMVITTQQPTYLDKHLRGLAKHQHLVEVFSGKLSNVYMFRSVREDITPTALADAEFTAWTHAKHLYPFYKSAEAHTKRFRMPKRFAILGVAAVAVLGLFVYAFWPSAATAADERAAGPKGPALAFAGSATSDKPPPMTATEYAERLIPRFASMPISAPAFDERPVVSNPEFYCMSSGPGESAEGWRDHSVTCLSEQGTRVDMREGEARTMARHGPVYNPFKAPTTDAQARADRPGGDFQPMAGTAVLAPHATAIRAPQISGYGDLGVALNPGPTQ